MKNLDKVMKWEEAEDFFIENHLPISRTIERQNGLEHCEINKLMRREEWDNWTDALCKQGEISDWQYENWSQPECCSREVALYKTTPGTRALRGWC